MRVRGEYLLYHILIGRMETQVELYTALVALALMCKIGVLHSLGIGWMARRVAESRREGLRVVAGVLISFAAVWIALFLLDIGEVILIPEWSYWFMMVMLIHLEVLYLLRLLAPTKLPKIQKSKPADVQPIQQPVVAEESSFQQMVREMIAEGSEQSADEESIATAFERWIETKEYLDQGITIQRVASEIHTNRTYLSAYINSQYNMNFREWVTSRRIDEAQRILAAERDAMISDVAQRVGFASVASFSRAFTRREGVSPVVWRGNCLSTGHDTKE